MALFCRENNKSQRIYFFWHNASSNYRDYEERKFNHFEFFLSSLFFSRWSLTHLVVASRMRTSLYGGHFVLTVESEIFRDVRTCLRAAVFSKGLRQTTQIFSKIFVGRGAKFCLWISRTLMKGREARPAVPIRRFLSPILFFFIKQQNSACHAAFARFSLSSRAFRKVGGDSSREVVEGTYYSNRNNIIKPLFHAFF